MTNKAFEALGNLLLPNLPGFVAKGPLVLIPPVNHLLRGLCFEGSRFGKQFFYVWAFVLPLFVPTQFLYFNPGTRIRRASGAERWDATAPDFIEELNAAIKREALPLISDLEAPGDIVKAILRLHELRGPHNFEAKACALALESRVDEAFAALVQLLAMLDLTVAWQAEMGERVEMLKAELLEDPARAQRRLLAWEEETVRNLKLEAFR